MSKMTDLKSRILAKAEFDEPNVLREARTDRVQRDTYCDSAFTARNAYMKGAQDENTRLKPLIEALGECAHWLDDWSKSTVEAHEWIKRKDEALANLERLLGEK